MQRTLCSRPCFRGVRVSGFPGAISGVPLLTAVLVCCLLLAGCGTKTPPSPVITDSPDLRQAAAQVWQQYLAASDARNTDLPYRLSASLRYETADSGHRLVMRAWGNGMSTMRMDVEAGIGQTLARVRQDASSFIAYDPRNSKAYVHTGKGSPLLRFGLPIPFGMTELGHLLAGRFSSVIPQKFIRATLVPGGGFAYTLPFGNTDETSELTLDALGRPVEWRMQNKGTVTRLLFERYDEAAESLPAKYSILTGTDNNAVLLVKERAVPETRYTEEQLALNIPAGTRIAPLPRQ